jgi:flagellar protein FlaG
MFTTPIEGLGQVAPVPKGPRTQTSEKPAPDAEAQKTAGIRPPEDEVQVSTQAAEWEARPAEQEAATSSQDQLTDRLKEMLTEVQSRATSVSFQVESESGEVIVRIVNKESGDLVREIPPEEIRNLRENLQELKGILFTDIS